MMKTQFKKLALTAAIALVAGFSSLASAHDRFNETLGAGVGATDYFKVTCSDDGNGPAGHVEISVNDDTAGSNVLSVVVYKGTKAATATDVTGANGVYSPVALVANGVNGVYNVFVHKNIAGARTYDLSAHCNTGTVLGGTHTGTVVAAPTQNQ
jgi:hypothetical protein